MKTDKINRWLMSMHKWTPDRYHLLQSLRCHDHLCTINMLLHHVTQVYTDSQPPISTRYFKDFNPTQQVFHEPNLPTGPQQTHQQLNEPRTPRSQPTMLKCFKLMGLIVVKTGLHSWLSFKYLMMPQGGLTKKNETNYAGVSQVRLVATVLI